MQLVRIQIGFPVVDVFLITSISLQVDFVVQGRNRGGARELSPKEYLLVSENLLPHDSY